VSEASVRAQLLAQRDDVDLWGVYADILHAADDPRGALVTLMLQRERAPSLRLYDSELAYRAQHRDRLQPRGFHRHPEAIAWKRGFPVGMAFDSPAAVAEALRDDACAAFVETARPGPRARGRAVHAAGRADRRGAKCRRTAGRARRRAGRGRRHRHRRWRRRRRR
jgi:hypothetical protein